MLENIGEISDHFNKMGLNYNTLHLYFLKHIERHRKCNLYVPKYNMCKFVEDLRFMATKLPDGKVFDREFQKVNHVPIEKQHDNYKYIVQVFDINTNRCIRNFICETSNEIWEEYVIAIENTWKIYKMMNGESILGDKL